MPTKPVFAPRGRDGQPLMREPVPFTPLIYLAGTTAHRFALHRELNLLPERMKHWIVSDPVSGAMVCRVRGTYKGLPVASSGLTLRDARSAAMATLDELLERVGSDAFNARLAAAHAEFAPASEVAA